VWNMYGRLSDSFSGDATEKLRTCREIRRWISNPATNVDIVRMRHILLAGNTLGTETDVLSGVFDPGSDAVGPVTRLGRRGGGDWRTTWFRWLLERFKIAGDMRGPANTYSLGTDPGQ
jgi:hypothetical protein